MNKSLKSKRRRLFGSWPTVKNTSTFKLIRDYSDGSESESATGLHTPVPEMYHMIKTEQKQNCALLSNIWLKVVQQAHQM